jgi:hypothetical protein
LTIRELIEEQRKRVRSRNPAERLAAVLLIPAELSRRLRLLSNSEIAQLLDDEVYGNMSILAPEATVCVEAALRLRPRAGGAHLIASAELSVQENEVVGKVDDAESQLKQASESRDAHLAGRVRATVSRLLRELAAKIDGDLSF